MFDKLFSFSFQRSGAQAVGWYFFYVLIVFLCSFVVGVILGSLFGGEDIEVLQRMAQQWGALLYVASAMVLGYIVLSAKGLLGDLFSLAVFLIALPLSYFGGPLFGLPLLAYLTTKSSKGSVSGGMHDDGDT